jgi:hypothetical protein
MRFIALDVHRDFCEVAIKDESGLRLAGKVKTSLAELELFAQSLAPDDQLALEATGPALQIARILEPHVGRVLIANTRKCSAIAQPKVKTDQVDAKTLCELLAAAFLPAVSRPMSSRARCADACSVAQSSCAPERERRTNATRCWRATSRAARRCQTYSARRAASGWQRSSFPQTSADGRGLSARGRLPGLGDRLDRARARTPGARLAGDRAPDDRARCEPCLGRLLRGCGRRRSPFQLAEEAHLLPRARSPGAPVRPGAGASRTDLQAGLRGSSPHAVRGGLGRDPHAGPAARLL